MYIASLFFRIYVMEKAEELELFTAELFKRPLVLQPSAHIGRGLAAISCTMFTKEGMLVYVLIKGHSLSAWRLFKLFTKN